MRETTVGRLLVERALPRDLRGLVPVLDAKGTKALFQSLAERHPERYREVAKRVIAAAREAAYASGGMSFDLEDLVPPPAAERHAEEVRRRVRGLLADRSLGPELRKRKIVETLAAAARGAADDIYAEALAAGNPLALQVASGARGNKSQLKSLLGGDYLYEDHQGNPVPMAALSSYARGLSPAEYLAASFGARKGVFDVKDATQKTGYFAKQLLQAAHRLVVTAQDDERTPDRPVGLPAEVDDPDNEGAFLAWPAGGYPRNTLLSPAVLRDLKGKGVARVLVRSPLVGGPADGGVYARDVVVRERGAAAPVGDFVGVAASQALCLAAGTRVRMADGTARAIEAVLPGELVLGIDPLGRTRPVRVLALHAQGRLPVQRARFRGPGGAFEEVATLAHRFVVRDLPGTPGRCRQLAHLPLGTPLLAAGGDPAPGRDTVYEGRRPAGLAECFDLEVEGPDHLFVLASGLATHNSEKLTQGGLSSKHSGGVAGAAQAVGGFRLLEGLVQSPEQFPAWATLAARDGEVLAVEPAPQGGHHVWVGQERHYVPEGVAVTAKKGDRVEAGDTLSEGIADPELVVRHKGLGEGRRYFVRTFLDAYRRAGLSAHRRNVELVARGLLDFVRLREETDHGVPDDLVRYEAAVAGRDPRDGARELAPAAAVGKYLEAPVLHHAVGDRVTRGMLRDLAEFGVGSVLVHDEPPEFAAEFVRNIDLLQHDEDWMTRQLGSNLQKSLLEAVHRGRASDRDGTSFVPAAAHRTTFGREGKTRGFDPAAPAGPRDGDGDGLVEDGTPRERPARPARLLAGLFGGAGR